MALDQHKNFAYSAVATAPSPATSGTTLVVTAAQGALFPTPPFNATIWPAGSNPTAANAEIVRVTSVSTDTLTIVRAQEGTTARTVVVGDQIAATITAKTLTDAEFPWSYISVFAWTMVANNGYIANSGSLLNFTLPATCAMGERFIVVGYAVGGWKINQNAGQLIHFGAQDTTTGTGGSLQSTKRYDVVQLVCNLADTEFTVIGSVGNITVV